MVVIILGLVGLCFLKFLGDKETIERRERVRRWQEENKRKWG